MSAPTICSSMDSIDSGVQTSSLLWPDFRVVDDLVFFHWCAPESGHSHAFDKTDIESTLNHIHVLDCFDHAASVDDEPGWDRSHADFSAACAFGKRWAQAVAAKLALDFPGRTFFVY